MKKIASLLLFAIHIVWAAVPQSLIHRSSDIDLTVVESGGDITFSYTFPVVKIEERGGYISLALDGTAVVAKSGEPQLPYIPLKVALPQGMEIDTVCVSFTESDTITLSNPISMASQYGISSDITVTVEPSSAYRMDHWPEQAVSNNGVQHKQGNRVASLQLFPVVYLASTDRIVQGRKVDVTVSFRNLSNSRSVDESSVIQLRTVSKEILGVENSTVQSGTNSRSSSAAQYLVITADSLAKSSDEFSLDTLLSLHRSNGLSTKILTVESIRSGYTGVDLQEKIRNAIIDHYNNEGTEYVLLAGDTPIIPERLLFLDEAPSSFNKGVPSDLYYACLDGTFNSDGDDKFGERNDGINGAHPDHFAEVHVGRFSVENSIELSNIVKKTVAHLTEISNGSILLAGEKLGFGGVSEYAKPSLEELWSGGVANGYLTRSFSAEPDLQKRSIYAEQFPQKKWRDTSIIPLINENSIGIINHIGHGYANVNLRIYTNSKNLDSIRNTKPIFVFSQACLSGSFQDESISEYLTTGTQFGMWGGVWNSDNGLGAYGSTDSPSQFMNRNFWHGYFGRDLNRVGDLLSYMHEMAYDESVNNWAFRWSSYITNLQGDPAAHFNLRGNTPIIELDSIGSGNVWDRGHEFELTWYDNIATPLSLDLYQNGSFVRTIESSLVDVQSYNWTIAEDISTGSGYSLRLFSESDNTFSSTEEFSIDPKSELHLLSPIAGDTLYKGSITEIVWEDNLTESVSLLVFYKGEVWDTIASDISSDISSFSWDIPLALTHDTAYQVAVVSCEKEWLIAKNETPISIFSPVENTFPFSDDFESYSAGTNLGFWSQRTDDSFDWTIRKGPTPSRVQADDWWNTTGPNSDASGNGNYIYGEATGNAGGKSAGLISAPFNIEGLIEGTLSFKVHMYNKEDNGNMGNLALYLLIDGESHRVINMTGAKGDRWITKEVDLSPYQGAKELQAYFKMRTGKSFASDIAIDEFSIVCTKGDVSLQNIPNNIVQSLLVSPQVVTNEASIIVQFPENRVIESSEYMLFDVVGNMVGAGQLTLGQYNRGTVVIPSDLASGSYLLITKVISDKTEYFKTIIGKKE